MKHIALIGAVALLSTALHGQSAAQPQMERARLRGGDLRFGCYATSRQVEQLATDEAFRTRAWETFQRIGITKLYVEVYRGGHVVPAEQLRFVRDWLAEKDIEAVGGIATVPGGDFGVRQEGPLHWFNWQNEKTQRDLRRVIRTAAGIFDRFIVDDFLCTGDVSAESKVARGDRSWGEYRRALLTELARSVFVEPAKEVNPSITMIVKYPQWYDRFHLFGYDTETFPRIFDRVWVGTETRGRNTQRFGFVQPYEGFVNYRWLAAIAGPKIGGAWFDHGDCAEYDFLNQAYMSVLAGANELVFFNLGNVVHGHPDHAKVIAEFDRLADLAAVVRKHAVIGVPAYKPPNSDPGGDMYLMDFLGMLGIPIIPVHEFPETAPVMFLPAQAAADPSLPDKIRKAQERGVHLIVTTSLLIALSKSNELARLVGVVPNLKSDPIRVSLTDASTETKGRESTAVMIDLESPIKARPGDVTCVAGGQQILFLRTAATPSGSISLLNTHTYSQADFDAVGEVLLCPRPLGLLTMHGPALSALRSVFHNHSITESNQANHDRFRTPAFHGRSCVTFHPFYPGGDGSCVIQNFNASAVSVSVTTPIQEGKPGRFVERFAAKPVAARAESKGTVVLDILVPARGRVWIQQTNGDAAH